jgi:hypothetical protein
MHFAFSDDQLEMRDLTRDTLSKLCPPDAVRAAWDTRPVGLWSQLAEIGLTGASAPEDIGGLGLGATDWVLLLEEAGRSAVPAPLVEAVAAVPFLAQAGMADLAGHIAAGDATAAIAFGDGFALDADVADIILHVDGVRVSALRDPTLTPQPAIDGARRLFAVSGARQALDGDGAGLVRRATLATSAQLLGLGQHVLDEAVAYAKTRHQFRKPIGSFQAVQHQLVDASLKLRFASPMVHRAAWSIDEADPDVDLHVSMATLYAAEAARQACRTSLQVHGAIGYTFELNLHLWMKRIWSLAATWGGDADHRQRAAATVLGDD